MDDRRIARALHDIARKGVPDDMNLNPEIRARLYGAGRRAARSRGSWAAIVVAAMLALAAATFAAVQILQPYLDPGLQAASEADLVTPINEARTVDGVTVLLEYAYADANRISLGMSSAGRKPQNVQYRFEEIRLRTADGVEVPIIFGGGGGGGGGGGSPTDLADYEFRQDYSFDAQAIPDILDSPPETLALAVEITVRRVTLDPDTFGSGSGTSGGGGGGGGGTSDGMGEAQQAPGETIEALGTLSWEFTLPLIPARVATVNQTAIDDETGISIKLGRVSVTPSMIRADLCFEPVDSLLNPQVTLTIDGEALPLASSEISFAGAPAESEPGCVGVQFIRSLYQSGENWRIAVTGLERMLANGMGGGGGPEGFEAFVDVPAEHRERVRAQIDSELNAAEIEATVESTDGRILVRTGSEFGDQLFEVLDRAIIDVMPGEWTFDFTLPQR